MNNSHILQNKSVIDIIEEYRLLTVNETVEYGFLLYFNENQEQICESIFTDREIGVGIWVVLDDELFKEENIKWAIIAHNHPSPCLSTPSEEDMYMHSKFYIGLKQCNIELISMIFTKEKFLTYYSSYL